MMLMKKYQLFSLVFAMGGMAPCFSAEDVPASMPTASAAIMQTLLGLALVVGVIYLLAWLLKRLNVNGINQNKQIKVLTATSLGAREKAVLIQVKGRELLLGVSPGRITTLHVFEKTENSINEPTTDAYEDASDGDELESKGLVSSLAASSASEFSKKLNVFLGSGNKS